MHKTCCFLVIFLLINIASLAQRVETYMISPQGKAQSTQKITGLGATALAIRCSEYLGQQISVYVDETAVIIPLDPDAPDFTYFLSLDRRISRDDITISTAYDVQLFLINSGSSPEINYSKYRYSQEYCSFDFAAVPQQEWRAGLPSPNYKRTFTDVKHIIVHHSAGSNSNTNYTQVVRDIYLYHTEINGWSDIGYNYLIAQDGTIYSGRDPGDGKQDDVRGAHFCGANSNTMGICLLGNYQTIHPTTAIWESLQQICAYKIDDKNLNPDGVYEHQLGSLGSISGHRDGCSTLCPGENVYDQIEELRLQVAKKLDECSEPETFLDFSLSHTRINAGNEVLMFNNSTGYSHYQWIFEGGHPDTAYWISDGEVQYTYPGNFDITLIGYRDNTSDTLKSADAVEVMGVPLVFPNPVTNNRISIGAEGTITQLQLFGLSGRQFEVRSLGGGEFYLPNIDNGTFVIRFLISGRWYSEKLIVY